MLTVRTQLLLVNPFQERKAFARADEHTTVAIAPNDMLIRLTNHLFEVAVQLSAGKQSDESVTN